MIDFVLKFCSIYFSLKNKNHFKDLLPFFCERQRWYYSLLKELTSLCREKKSKKSHCICGLKCPWRVPKMPHWSCIAAYVCEYPLLEWTRQRMKMDLLPRLGLGTICIAPLCEVSILLKHVSRVQVWGQEGVVDTVFCTSYDSGPRSPLISKL